MQTSAVGYAGRRHKQATTIAPSVPRIADQRLARPEHQHQQNTQYAHDGKNRLVEDHPDDTVPEPGRMTLHPGPKRLLAGLVNIVPELAELREVQGLVGDTA